MPFFDFHCHPGLKPQFSDPATKPSPWDNISARLAVFNSIQISINALFNEVLNSQSSLSQLVGADVKLIGLILHAPEQKIGQALGEKKIVNKGQVNLINKKQLTYLSSGVHSFELINAELNWLLTSVPPQGMTGASLKLLNHPSDFKENSPSTVFAMIIVEGLHCFFSDPNDVNAKAIFTQNFIQFTGAHKVMAINICHMQQNPFCNHAHGIQFFNPGYFYPTRKGISTWGREVIQMMLDRKILTDIKHMSLWARWELYSWFRDDDDETVFLQPIICTHAGTTGLSIKDRVKYLYRKPTDKGLVYEVTYLKPRSRHDDEIFHNCSSINLYDEDIEQILLSGGIIGLSFDQRILGFADESVIPSLTDPHDVEYISHMEADFFLGPNPAALPVWNGDDEVWAAEELANLDPSLLIERHRRFLINNIIHILWVANKHPEIGLQKAAKQICLGTDFDGLINAIDCCKQTSGLPQLKKELKASLTTALSRAGLNISATTLLNGIFYDNGKTFLLNRLALMSVS